MPESKTELDHVEEGGERFKCSTGDMTGRGFEIVVDKRTHELVIPKDGETEETVKVIIRPRQETDAKA